MTDEIIQLTAGDFEETMDFLNLVFGAHSPHDFARMLPAIYRPTDPLMACNYAIRKNGHIRAVVGMYPIEWRMGDARLRASGVGAVSTHPNYRRTGMMKALMNHCVGLMREQEYHLSCLGGQRQRYGYFGYERCGSACSFTVNRSNIRHCFDCEPHIRFEPIAREDQDRLARAKTLHDAQPLHCPRAPEDFYNHCVGWHHRPFAALDGEDRMVGYLVAAEKGDYVTELLAEDDDTAVRMVHAWIARRSESATFEMPPTAAGLAHKLGQICDRARLGPSGNWQVFDWIAATDALMKMRRLCGPMADGAVVVGIENYGPMRLQVSGEAIGCGAADEPPDVQCDPLTAMRLLFGPLPPSLVMELPTAATLLESWCPLPLYWPRQDGV